MYPLPGNWPDWKRHALLTGRRTLRGSVPPSEEGLVGAVPVESDRCELVAASRPHTEVTQGLVDRRATSGALEHETIACVCFVVGSLDRPEHHLAVVPHDARLSPTCGTLAEHVGDRATRGQLLTEGADQLGQVEHVEHR